MRPFVKLAVIKCGSRCIQIQLSHSLVTLTLKKEIRSSRFGCAPFIEFLISHLHLPYFRPKMNKDSLQNTDISNTASIFSLETRKSWNGKRRTSFLTWTQCHLETPFFSNWDWIWIETWKMVIWILFLWEIAVFSQSTNLITLGEIKV